MLTRRLYPPSGPGLDFRFPLAETKLMKISGIWRLVSFLFFSAALSSSCNKTISLVKIDDGLNAEEHIRLGSIYLANGETFQARQQFQRATIEDRKNADGWFGLGLAEHSLGHFRSAALAFEKVLNLKPDYAEAHNNLADSYLRLGKIEDAVREARAAIRLGGEQAAFYHLTYAEALIAVHDLKSACAEMEAARNLGRDNPLLLGQLEPLEIKHCHGR